MQTALHKERSLLREILSTIPYHVFWKDRSGRYLGCYRRFAESAGISDPEDIYGLTDFDLPWATEESEAYVNDDEQVMSTGESKLHIEETQTQQDGTVLTVDTCKAPLRNDRGDVIGIIGVYMDITDRKLLESQLMQAQKLESIGQLAAGIAHEINTPTQYVSDNTRFLNEQLGNLLMVVEKYAQQIDPEKPEKDWTQRVREIREPLEAVDYDFIREEIPLAIEQSLDALERISTIIGAMKDFSHPGTEAPESVDLNNAIEGRASGRRAARGTSRSRHAIRATSSRSASPTTPTTSSDGSRMSAWILQTRDTREDEDLLDPGFEGDLI